jgi:hypothetical protein
VKLDRTPVRLSMGAGQRVRLVGEGLALVEAKGEARLTIL